MGGWIMNSPKKIRNKLYDLLLSACNSDTEVNEDINISQKLGVAMTNAVRKGGVVNIISQSITVHKVIPKIIEIIKDVDELEEAPCATVETLRIEHLNDPVEDCCEYFFDKRATWKEFRETTKKRYFDYARSKSRSNTEAARILNVSASMVTKSLREIEVGHENS